MPKMTVNHPQWDDFLDLLEGPKGCNFRKNDKGTATWTCGGGNDKTLATRILKEHYPEVDIPASLAYFHKRGGHCDCEIAFNVSDHGE